eukprot:Tamp_07922.p1 GENE.Tamp_07922~~Tamp_07922.p1  ORF type:complete len:660 (+),score=185.71 Tamp_07922:97-1980(+)
MQDEDATTIAAEMQDALGPLLEGVDETDVQALCTKIANVFKGLGEDGTDASGAADKVVEDHVVKCDNIILAYAGKSLLRSSSLRLVRGRRYGIVGQNGVGKTTLLTRIDAGDIANFPTDIKVVFVRHEILANDDQNVLQYIATANAGAKSEAQVKKVLEDVGFTEQLQKNSVLELSGGWRMKLALAGAILSSADLLLLDEPTNHLDVASVAWLAEYLKTLTDTTVVIVSHDYDFLNNVITDVVHFCDHQLHYYPDGWGTFAAAKPEVIKALPQKKNASYFAQMTGQIEALIKFPDPGTLDGIKSRLKPMATLKNVTFTYPGTEKQILNQVSVKLCMSSRVALLGPNGAGKTTLLKLLVGDLDGAGPGNTGEVWKHQNLRVSYIAQHSMHHLEENISLNPITYIQKRFFQGRDKELAKMVTMAMTDEDKAAMQKPNAIREITGRAMRGGNLCYQVRKVGRRDQDETWEPLDNIKHKEAYVLKLVKAYDEKMKTLASGVDIRPITETEIRLHLENYGILDDLATSKLKGFSGGQKSRVVIAAAMWTRPHLICLDEPTNFLDKETFNALVRALKNFKGAVLTISHNQEFVEQVASEKWTLANGCMSVQTRKDREAGEEEAPEGDDGKTED